MIQIYGPAFEQTLHLVLDKEDIVPPILCYFGIGCVLKSHTLTKNASKQVKSTSLSDPERLKTVHAHIFITSIYFYMIVCHFKTGFSWDIQFFTVVFFGFSPRHSPEKGEIFVDLSCNIPSMYTTSGMHKKLK